MHRALVSVVVPVYNGGRYLADALRSIFEQDYRPIEVIVVDDGSTDDSAAVARSFEGVRYLYQENQGVSAARNAGITAAQGRFVAFLDQDDLWAPGKLRLQVGYLEGHPEVRYLIARARYFVEPGSPTPVGLKPELLQGDHLARLPGTLLAHRSLFEQVGLYDTDLAIANDVDWFVRAKDKDLPYAVLPDVLLYRRAHGENLSSDAQVNNRELLRLLRQSVERQRRKQVAVERGEG